MEIRDLEPTIKELVRHVGSLKNEVEDLKKEIFNLKKEKENKKEFTITTTEDIFSNKKIKKAIHIGTVEPRRDLVDKDKAAETMAYIIGAMTKYATDNEKEYDNMDKDLCKYIRGVIHYCMKK